MKAEKDGIKFELMPTENKKLKSFELENPDEYFSNSLKKYFLW